MCKLRNGEDIGSLDHNDYDLNLLNRLVLIRFSCITDCNLQKIIIGIEEQINLFYLS